MFMEKYRLDGKTALIVGASRGIGKAIALGFAEAGADIVITSRKIDDLQLVADEISALGRRCLPISAHVAKKEDINELVSKTVAIFGRIDILVNGAATSPFFGEVTDMEEWAWDAIMNLNLKGMFMLCQAVTKIMIKNGGGCILNIASSYGLKPFPGTAAYSISKAGTIMLTQALAVELGKYNIRVNAIAPGVTKTRFSQPLMQDPKLLNSIIEHTALHRIAEPEDIVGTAILLVSTASQHITGQTICIDGGSISL